MVRNIDALVRSGKITAAEGARRKAQQALDRVRANPQMGNAPRGAQSNRADTVEVDITGEYTVNSNIGGWDLFWPGTYAGPLSLYDNVSLSGVRIVVTTGLVYDKDDERMVFGLSQSHTNMGILPISELKGAVAVRRDCLGTRFNFPLRPSDRRVFVRNGHLVSEDEFGSLNLLYAHEAKVERASYQLRVVLTFSCSKRKPSGVSWELNADHGDGPSVKNRKTPQILVGKQYGVTAAAKAVASSSKQSSPSLD